MATPFKDLTGKTYNRWTVIEQAPSDPARSQTLWRCRCSCGVVKEAVAYCSLTSGRSGSCGCVMRERGERRRAMLASSVKKHTTYPWRGATMKLMEIARQENVDAQELRRLVVVKGMPLDDAVIELVTCGRTFHERAASHGATSMNRTSQKRTRHFTNGRLVRPVSADPLADIW